MDSFPAIADLEKRAKRRIPSFAWVYLESGTGADHARDHNRDALANVRFRPQFLKGPLEPSTATTLFDKTYNTPIGIAPVGLTGLIWPGADEALARTGASKNIPYVLSTVGTASPEDAGTWAGGNGWFQLYPPRDVTVRSDLVQRAADAGLSVLVVTADVPAPSRRERQRKAHIRVPPKIDLRLALQAATRPAWTKALAREGMPRFRSLEAYVDEASMKNTAGFVGANLGGTLSWDYLDQLRREWDGPLVVKGILDPDDAEMCLNHGADGVWVSNHGGRQLDGAIASIDALSPIVERINGRVPVMFDSGIRDGLDIARALALGADFCFAGRPFLFGLCALGDSGAAHAHDILHEGLTTTMHQVGVQDLGELASRLA